MTRAVTSTPPRSSVIDDLVRTGDTRLAPSHLHPERLEPGRIVITAAISSRTSRILRHTAAASISAIGRRQAERSRRPHLVRHRRRSDQRLRRHTPRPQAIAARSGPLDDRHRSPRSAASSAAVIPADPKPTTRRSASKGTPSRHPARGRQVPAAHGSCNLAMRSVGPEVMAWSTTMGIRRERLLAASSSQVCTPSDDDRVVSPWRDRRAPGRPDRSWHSSKGRGGRGRL